MSNEKSLLLVKPTPMYKPFFSDYYISFIVALENVFMLGAINKVYATHPVNFKFRFSYKTNYLSDIELLKIAISDIT